MRTEQILSGRPLDWAKLKYKVKYQVSKVVMPNSPSASTVPFVEYLKWQYYTHFTPRYPYSIDIQTRSGCNAHCEFCGVGREKNKLKGVMNNELFEQIIDEALTFPLLMKINPFLLNDPLVDRKIEEKIEYITRKKNKRKFPLVRIITNAGLLTEERAYRLLHSGLDELNISFHSIIPDVYEEMMPPLKFEKVMGNIRKLVELRDKVEVKKKPKISIWTVLTKPVEDNLKNEKDYWKNLGVGFVARKLDNRASNDIDVTALGARPMDLVQICPIPFWRAWIMWNGDMIMCCVDQERSSILGNCTHRSIRDIWNDRAYQDLRHRWRTRQLGGLLCDNCKGS
ncbi:MAG: radical SAM protein [Arenicellales bacterium]|nr:radical SAM protein [Arenicellales bacterium]